MSGLKILLLLSCWINTGITAMGPTTHYRARNSSICLRVRKSPPYEDVRWSFSHKLIVRNTKVTESYKDRTDYGKSDGTLCIHKLCEKDSGIYIVSVVVNDTVLVESHKLNVQETVPTPVIRMSVIYSNQAVGFCNITVNCSVQDEWLNSVCDGDGCMTERSSFKRVNITIITSNGSVFCSCNNYVSTSNASESREAKCFTKSTSEPEEASQSRILAIIILTTFAVLLTVFVVIACVTRGCSTKYICHQTSTVQSIQSQPVHIMPQPEQRHSSSSSDGADPSYENVNNVTRPSQTSSPIIGQSRGVDTVYCHVQKPKESASPLTASKRVETEAVNLQEASTSQATAPSEAEKIDTVYSVLQKPKNLTSQHHQQDT